MNIIKTVKVWEDSPDLHQKLFNDFRDLVNADPGLKNYRDWIETNIFGFGERPFLWMWKIITDNLPDGFSFLEIGVFRGQILGLIGLLRPDSVRYGITPLDSTGGHWESNYRDDIIKLHKTFNISENYNLIVGDSTDETIINQARLKGKFDIIYIDGGHDYPIIKSDLNHYPDQVKTGGFLIVDDASHKYNLPAGMFKGIESVGRAVDEWIREEGYFIELFSIGHNRVFYKAENPVLEAAINEISFRDIKIKNLK